MSEDPFDPAFAFVVERPDNDGQPCHVTPNDPGKATAWGVTFASYGSAWQRMHGATPTLAAFQALTMADTSPLYRALFWNAKPVLLHYPTASASWVFGDAAVGSAPLARGALAAIGGWRAAGWRDRTADNRGGRSDAGGADHQRTGDDAGEFLRLAPDLSLLWERVGSARGGLSAAGVVDGREILGYTLAIRGGRAYIGRRLYGFDGRCVERGRTLKTWKRVMSTTISPSASVNAAITAATTTTTLVGNLQSAALNGARCAGSRAGNRGS